jgi:phenylalanyl-tRNA synthetase, alpha subunit
MDLSPQEVLVLKQLSDGVEIFDSEIISEKFSSENIRGAVSWLEKKGLISVRVIAEAVHSLTAQGKDFLEHGLPETELFQMLLKNEVLTMEQIFKEMDRERAKIGITQMAKFGVKPVSGRMELPESNDIETILDIREKVLSKIAHNSAITEEKEKDQLDNITKRSGLVDTKIRRKRMVMLTDTGKKMLDELPEEDSEGNLTSEMIVSGTWKDKHFRPYDLQMPGKTINRNGLHPLTLLIDKVRQIYLSMGFTEIKDNIIELAGWNMDALFIPQDHPARDMQDTFFMDSDLATLEDDDEKLFRKIGNVHRSGMRGYTGWASSWSMNETRKTLLRTHTTASTLRALHKQPDSELAVFSVDKVFRHESVDWKHLAEFYQMEGAIHSKNANLSTLKWFLKKFYSRLGFDEIELIPSYYPYTEPSIDIIVIINGKEVEMGGSGVIRPEVRRPLGLKNNVIAWGMGLERLALMYYGLDDVRKLYNSDIDWLRSYRIKF